jgi:putative PIN family toxin of toxin-antitoxin system
MRHEHDGDRRRKSGLRVVFYTNVYVSIFNWPDGLLAEIWRHARKGMYELFVSPHIINEVARVLREDFGWEEHRLRTRIKRLVRVGKIVTYTTLPDAIKEDPDDNHILACATAGNANLIVSRDLDLLRLKQYEGIGIMSPIDFLHILEGLKKAA